ncbi:MAG: T9SS type A sorting domain-containing protein [Bacteroidota bacterium]
MHLTSPVILSESISSFISSIPELKGEVKIFPNPISSLLQIQANALPVGKLNFQVLDVFGRICWEMENHTVEANLTLNIPASNWFPGVYYLKITDNKAIKTIAFVKN